MNSLMGGVILLPVIALTSGFLGFGGAAGTARKGVRLLSCVAVVFLIVSAAARVFGRLQRARRNSLLSAL